MECFCYEDTEKLTRKNWAFTPLLFHSPAYVLNRFKADEILSFTIEEAGVILGIIYFHQTPDGYISMSRSPFGGLSAARNLSVQDCRQLVSLVLERLAQKTTTVYFPFNNYPGTHHIVFVKTLVDAGFKIASKDLHQFLPLRSEGEILQNMHPSQKRKLKRSGEAGFSFQEEPGENLVELHRFIHQCRLNQGLVINISEEDFRVAVQELPGVYHGFSVRDKGQIIAACITSHVSDEVLYYYLPGSASSHRSFSPMVMLVYELARWSHQKGYKILDLGKSSLHGEIQEGLATFKRRMGALDGERLCLVKDDNLQ